MHHILFKEGLVWGSVAVSIGAPLLGIAKAKAIHAIIEKLREFEFRPGFVSVQPDED